MRFDDTKDRTKKVIVDHLGVDAEKVVDDASLVDDLGADSLDVVELEMAFEEEFDFRFPNENGTLDVGMTFDQVVAAVDEARVR